MERGREMEIRPPSEYFKKKILFETERLILRRIELGDAKDLYSYASREETSRYLLWIPHRSEYSTRSVIEGIKREYKAGTYYELAVVLRENGKMIGTSGITSFDQQNQVAEIGYVISPDYWGMGIAKEAASVLMNFAFCELGVNRVEAKYMMGNENSRRVMEKLGMEFEGVQRSKLFVKGAYRDIGICSILASEYFSVPRENLYKKYNGNSIFSGLFNCIK